MNRREIYQRLQVELNELEGAMVRNGQRQLEAVLARNAYLEAENMRLRLALEEAQNKLNGANSPQPMDEQSPEPVNDEELMNVSSSSTEEMDRPPSPMR